MVFCNFGTSISIIICKELSELSSIMICLPCTATCSTAAVLHCLAIALAFSIATAIWEFDKLGLPCCGHCCNITDESVLELTGGWTPSGTPLLMSCPLVTPSTGWRRAAATLTRLHKLESASKCLQDYICPWGTPDAETEGLCPGIWGWQ